MHSEHTALVRLATRPDDKGSFVFYLDLNPDNNPLPSVGERYFDYSVNCPDCHFSSDAALPLGELLLEITAVHPDGRQISATRQVTVDRSELATLPVEVILSGDFDFALDNIPVQAETRLYEWRGRLFRGLTRADGRVQLNVEALSQRSTEYLISVPPTMIGSRRYQSLEAVTTEIAPGTVLADPVTLTVFVEDGRITGHVETVQDRPSLSADAVILAIAWPGGLVYNQPLHEDNSFSFSGLPLSKYIVTVTGAGTGQEWPAQTAQLDLTEEAEAEVALVLDEQPDPALHGRLVDENGRPIPFGWLAESGSGYVGQASPLNGRFTVPGTGSEPKTLQATAPGYWSQPVLLEGGSEQEIQMQPRPDRRALKWGSGQIYLPAQSVVTEDEDALSLVRGWIWGYNDQADLLLINLEGAELKMQAADFALEYAPGEVSWLYVKEGEVQFISREGLTQQIAAGEMMALGDGVPLPQPVEADELVVNLLRAGRKPPALLPAEPEPSAAQRLGAGLANFGRSLSQVIVGGTYALMILATVGALLFGLRKLWQVRG
jgi:hypothetical protein